MPEQNITTLEQLVPYILAAVTVILSASAYYVRDALRERSRVIKQKNDLDVARREMDLKLNEQEINYKRELQDTITDLNEQMAKMQARHQASLDKEIQARIALEKRITEIENKHKQEISKLESENKVLKKQIEALKRSR